MMHGLWLRAEWSPTTSSISLGVRTSMNCRCDCSIASIFCCDVLNCWSIDCWFFENSSK